MKILLTGCAGFIGMHTCERLLARGDEVVGVDNLNDYYDPALKQARLARLVDHPSFRFERLDIADAGALDQVFATHRPQRVRRRGFNASDVSGLRLDKVSGGRAA
jgi:UDP-glucuronate 4-epimerase